MARRKGIAPHLEGYREALDQIRRLWPELRLTPLCFFDSWTDAGGPPPALSRAAEYFGLHLEKSAEQALLLHILADAVFGEHKKGRRRKNKGKWDAMTLIQLAVDCNKIKEEAPGISDKKAMWVIKNRYRDRYKYATPETMLQHLGLARDWLEMENRHRADRGMAPLTSELTRPIFTVE
jgi:hypothetical protein